MKLHHYSILISLLSVSVEVLEMDECILKSINKCSGTTLKLQTGGPNRVRSIIEASKIYGDGLHETLEPQSAANEDLTITYHNNCVASYASKFHIHKFLKRAGKAGEEHEAPAAKRIRRSESQTIFKFKEHCIFCREKCLMNFDSKHPDRWRRVVLCRTADRKDQNTFKQSIIDT